MFTTNLKPIFPKKIHFFSCVVLGIIASFFQLDQAFAATALNTSNTNVVTSGLVGYWTFDGKNMTNATATDMSGGGKNGTLTSMTTATNAVTGQIGQAMRFDGIGSRIRFSNTPLSTFSFSFWAKTASTSQIGIILGDTAANNSGGNKIGFVGGNIFVRSGGIECTSVSVPIDGKWHHWTITRDNANTWTVYRDGIATNCGTGPGSTTYTLNRIGANGGDDQFYIGSLDDIRVYNRAITAAEVQTLFKAGGGILQLVTPTSGLAGHWTFDNANMTTSTSTDSSGYRKDARLNNMTSSSLVVGKLSQALSFDGVNDYVRVSTYTGAQFANTTFTLTGWFKTGSSGNQALIAQDYCSGGFEILLSSGAMTAATRQSGSCGGTTALRTSAGGLANGQWHHFAVVITTDTVTTGNNTITMYIDGVLNQGGLTQSNPYGIALNPSFDIGARFDGTDHFLNGSLDDMRYYNKGLTAAEVQALYKAGQSSVVSAKPVVSNSNSVGINSGLVGYWTFDGKNIVNATATDSSGNGRNGTLTNMTQSSSKVIGKLGQGLNFDGTDDYVSIPYSGIDFERTQPVTVSAWVKLNNVVPAGGYQTIFGRFTGSSQGMSIGWCKNAVANQCASNSYGFALSGGPTNNFILLSTGTGTGSPGKWAHVVVTYGGNSLASGVKLYVNGNSLPLTVYSDTLSSTITSTTNWRIGDDGTTDYSSGVIDDVRFYNRALSATEVKSLYKLGSQ